MSNCKCTKCPHCAFHQMRIGAGVREKVANILERIETLAAGRNLSAMLPLPTVLFVDTNCVALMFSRPDGHTLKALVRPNGIVLMDHTADPPTETVVRQSQAWLGDLLGSVQTWYQTNIRLNSAIMTADRAVMDEAKRLVGLHRSGHQVDWNRALKKLGELTDSYDQARSQAAKL